MAKVIKTNNGRKGGLLKGKSHLKGGIKAIITDTNKPVELENNEVIIKASAVLDPTVKTLIGTNQQILSKINTQAGGVPIVKPIDGVAKKEGGTISATRHLLIDYIGKHSFDQFWEALKTGRFGAFNLDYKEVIKLVGLTPNANDLNLQRAKNTYKDFRILANTKRKKEKIEADEIRGKDNADAIEKLAMEQIADEDFKAAQENNEDINLNKKEDETNNIISRISEIRDRGTINAVADYLRNGAKSIKESRGSNKFKEQEELILKEYISKNNLWITPDTTIKIGEGAEQKSYLNGDYVIKLNESVFYLSWEDYFKSLLLHNDYFPVTAYQLVGFTKPTGKLSAVVKQLFIEETEPTDLSLVKEFMADKGFENTKNNDYFNHESGIILEDLHEGNVLTRDKILYFIDTVFYLKKQSMIPKEHKFPIGATIEIIDAPKNEKNIYIVIGYENYNDNFGWETKIQNANGETVTMFENLLKKKNKYKVGDKVYMFKGEPVLTVTEINEFSDKNPTYDIKSDDGSIIRNNISADKIYEWDDLIGKKVYPKNAPEMIGVVGFKDNEGYFVKFDNDKGDSYFSKDNLVEVVKTYSDIKSCLLSEGDEESNFIFEGKEFMSEGEKWTIIGFFKYGVIIEHIIKHKLHDKKDNRRLTFKELRELYLNNHAEIFGIDSLSKLDHCIKIIEKCIDMIDLKEELIEEKKLHDQIKEEIIELKKPKEEPKWEGKIPMKEIKIHWAEGKEYGFPKIFTSWEEANSALLPVLADATDGYNKTKFSVTFADGEIYEGRLAISEKEDNPAKTNNLIGKHIKDFLEYDLTKDTTSDESKKEITEWLEKYDLGSIEDVITLSPARQELEANYAEARDLIAEYGGDLAELEANYLEAKEFLEEFDTPEEFCNGVVIEQYEEGGSVPDVWKHKHMNATAVIISDTAKGYKVSFTDNTGKKPKTTTQFFHKQDFKGDRAIFEKVNAYADGGTVTTKDGFDIKKKSNEHKGHIFYSPNDDTEFLCLGFDEKIDDCFYINLDTKDVVVGCADGFRFAKGGKPESTQVQTLIFSKDLFTNSQAKDWSLKHNFIASKFDENIDGQIRVRQHQPIMYDKKSFRTIELKEGIKAVIGKPKK